MEGSSLISPFSVSNFSTLTYPARDRFGVWVQQNLCDCTWDDDKDQSFEATSKGADFGPFILAGRRWFNHERASPYKINRTEKRIRTDGQDFFRFALLRNGRLLCRQTTTNPIKKAGDLFLTDATQVNDCALEGDDIISLVVARDYLPSDAALLHSETLSGGIGLLVADHMTSLFENISNLKVSEIPYVVQATLHLLSAAVLPTPDSIRRAERPVQEALYRRIQRYIDEYLLDPDLTPYRICRDMGLSRAKLYKLFDQEGGVMHQVRRKRLRQAYRFLADPRQPRTRIAEVAWKHGFPDEKHFHRLFKNEFGHTPSDTTKPSRKLTSQSEERAGIKSFDESPIPIGWTLPYGVPSS